jgi:hypothetical protein
MAEAVTTAKTVTTIASLDARLHKNQGPTFVGPLIFKVIQ